MGRTKKGLLAKRREQRIALTPTEPEKPFTQPAPEIEERPFIEVKAKTRRARGGLSGDMALGHMMNPQIGDRVVYVEFGMRKNGRRENDLSSYFLFAYGDWHRLLLKNVERQEMAIIDERGFIHIFKWKINIIDFLCICFLLAIFPMSFFAYKITTRPKIVKPKATHYTFSKGCPNCGKSKSKEVPFGELIPKEWKDICDGCGNEVWYIKKPKSILEVELKEQIDNLLKEHKRLKRYFE